MHNQNNLTQLTSAYLSLPQNDLPRGMIERAKILTLKCLSAPQVQDYTLGLPAFALGVCRIGVVAYAYTSPTSASSYQLSPSLSPSHSLLKT